MFSSLKSVFEEPQEYPELTDGIRLGEGWHRSDTMIWSRDRKSHLIVSADKIPSPRSLRLWLQVFNACPARPKELRIHSPGHDSLLFKITSPETILLSLYTPNIPLDTGETIITLELDHIDSPFQVGTSTDERLLGLSISKLVCDRPLLASPLSFTDPDVIGEVLRNGWGQPDEIGVWSLGSRASLCLPGSLALASPARLRAEIDTLPRPGDYPPLIVRVYVDGTQQTTWTFGSNAPKAWECPLPDWNPDDDREVILDIENSLSPVTLGIGADPRPLGIRLKKLTLAQD